MNIKHSHSLKTYCKSEYYRSKSVKSFLAVIISVIAIISYSLQTGPVGPSVKPDELITPITPITPMARSLGLTSEPAQSTPIFPDLSPSPRQRVINVISDRHCLANIPHTTCSPCLSEASNCALQGAAQKFRYQSI